MKLTVVLIFFLLFSVTAGAQSFVVFTGEKDGNSDLFRMDLKTLSSEKVTNLPSNEMQATVSPDGRRIVFVSDKGGGNSLYIAELANPASGWSDISLGMGSHANPAFSPDGKKIAVTYAPDPERIYANTRLVQLDLETKKQSILIDSTSLNPASDSQAVMAVDTACWIDLENLVFSEVEFSDSDFLRITSSGIFRLKIGDPKPVHLAGGESYFDDTGNARGYRATMPKIVGQYITYSAIEGKIRRTPMYMTFDGKDKKVLPFSDSDFFGPVFIVGMDFLYGIQDDDGKLGLAIGRAGEKERKTISFPGSAMEPVLVTP